MAQVPSDILNAEVVDEIEKAIMQVSFYISLKYVFFAAMTSSLRKQIRNQYMKYSGEYILTQKTFGRANFLPKAYVQSDRSKTF